MTITFKNVGQGDSVIITWIHSGVKYAGIIDCKNYANCNPIVEHLKDSKIDKVFFIVLSHPHIDHYSGMLDLVEYCCDKAIPINYFLHTALPTEDYLRWYEIDLEDCKKLQKLYNYIIEIKKKGGIKKINTVIQDVKIPIHNEFELVFHSPSDDENRMYAQKVRLFQEKDEAKCSRYANLLASFVEFRFKNEYFIFTSDCEIETLERLRKENIFKSLDGKVIGIQIPHHGSKENHYPSFWRDLRYENNKTLAVVSAGDNQKYNHPHIETIKDFDDMTYLIRATNQVNGMADFIEMKEFVKASMSLDLGSELVEEYKKEGDVIIEI